MRLELKHDLRFEIRHILRNDHDYCIDHDVSRKQVCDFVDNVKSDITMTKILELTMTMMSDLNSDMMSDFT